MKTDVDLKRDVTAELGWDPAAKSTAIGVAVKDGVVTLSGPLCRHLRDLGAGERNAQQRLGGVATFA